MQPKKKIDLQTLSLFFILGVLTLAIVYFLKLVLFAPVIPLIESATR